MVAVIQGGSDEDLRALLMWDAGRAPDSVRDVLLECQRAVGVLPDTEHGEGCPNRRCARCSEVGRLVDAVESRQGAMQRVLRDAREVPEGFDVEARTLHELGRAARWARRKSGTDSATWHAVMRGQVSAPGGG